MARRKKIDLRVLGLGDDALMERLQKAAKAAGLDTVEQLVDLVVDSGVTARPPVDGLTERLTLDDLGVRLWTVANSQPRTARAKWFKGLTPTQKDAVVTTLRHRGYSPLAISNDFGITEMAIQKTWAKNRTELGSQVLGVRLDTLVGGIWAAKERAQQGAMEKEDWATYWRIEMGATNVLQDLGVVKRAAHRVEVVTRSEDVREAAMERLVRVAEQKAVRRLELKQVKTEVVDDLPDEIAASFAELKDV